jgi:hypothetical protein
LGSPEQVFCVIVVRRVEELGGGVGMSICYRPNKHQEIVVLVGQEGGIFVTHSFDGQRVGLPDDFDFYLTIEHINAHEVGL